MFPQDVPLITLITVTYNSSKYIKDALESIVKQDFKNFEYIVIDGNSKDETVKIVENFRPQFGSRMTVISEPDKGIYDAMNKGLRLAKGKVVGFLNSDDIFADSTILSQISAAFEAGEPDIIYADLVYVDQEDTNRVIRRWISGEIPRFKMLFGWHPAHPTFYVKNEILKRIGGFNTKYRLGADYALMLNIIQAQVVTHKYIRNVFVRMRMGGESNRSLKNVYDSNLECLQSWKDAGLSPSIFLIPTKLCRKLLQYFYARCGLNANNLRR